MTVSLRSSPHRPLKERLASFSLTRAAPSRAGVHLRLATPLGGVRSAHTFVSWAHSSCLLHIAYSRNKSRGLLSGPVIAVCVELSITAKKERIAMKQSIVWLAIAAALVMTFSFAA